MLGHVCDVTGLAGGDNEIYNAAFSHRERDMYDEDPTQIFILHKPSLHSFVLK